MKNKALLLLLLKILDYAIEYLIERLSKNETLTVFERQDKKTRLLVSRDEIKSASKLV